MRRLVLVVAVLHARLAACSIGDYPLPAASHSVLADTSVVYELLSTGETCEDNPGYTSIYSQNECSYAGNLVRCGLTAGKASCAGTTEYPCGCTYGPASAGADRLKFAQGCGFSGLPCSSTHQCVCRDAVSGSYSLVSSGSCDSNGLELVGGANECTAAAALLHLTGAKPPGCSGALGCCGTPILASTLATGDCYNKNRGPKCSVWTLSSGSTTGWLHYRPDNYTNSNRAPWSCSHPSPLACSSQHVKCLCKRARVQPPPSPPPPPGLPPGTALPPPPPVPSCVCAGDTVIREPTSTCSATGDPHYRNFAGYARAARTAACSCAARRGPRLPSAGLRVSPPSLSRTCTPRHGCAYYTHPGSSSSSAQAHTSRPDAVARHRSHSDGLSPRTLLCHPRPPTLTPPLTPLSRPPAHLPPHRRKFDYYARGLFEHARFPISPCGCEVVVQTLFVKLIAGRWAANSAIGAAAVRIGEAVAALRRVGGARVRVIAPLCAAACRRTCVYVCVCTHAASALPALAWAARTRVVSKTRKVAHVGAALPPLPLPLPPSSLSLPLPPTPCVPSHPRTHSLVAIARTLAPPIARTPAPSPARCISLATPSQGTSPSP